MCIFFSKCTVLLTQVKGFSGRGETFTSWSQINYTRVHVSVTIFLSMCNLTLWRRNLYRIFIFLFPFIILIPCTSLAAVFDSDSLRSIGFSILYWYIPIDTWFESPEFIVTGSTYVGNRETSFDREKYFSISTTIALFSVDV